MLLGVGNAGAQNTSAPAMLQFFEAKWDVMEDRMPDIFMAGYGRMWVPPPARADTGGFSVGYDVFDRFDLGKPGDETLYGTELGLKTLINQAHTAGVLVNTDFIPNHNGFSDSSTFDNFGTPGDTSDDVFWDESGGYPGFVTTLSAADDPNGVGDPDGDFHGAFETGEINFRLSGLIDIAQEKNHQFIRTPVGPDPQNIPAGTKGIFGRPPANVPDANNARFYPDQQLGGTTVFDPALNTNVTLYDFNTQDPLQGDAFAENATGLLIRNIRWMIQEVGVDGFRFDAGRHFPRWVNNFLDQGAFLAKKEPLLDGSPQHTFSFTEVGFDSLAFQQDFIRKDIDNNNLGQLGGNRDALDFNFFGAVKENLTNNGIVNDWREVKNKSIDINDDGFANNGSQGVAFVQSHDDGPAYLNNVAHAYMLMRPGNAIVYFNGDQFDDPLRAFPESGRGDALGGMFGDAVTTLVNIRNTHGRGNYLDRTAGADEKELLIYERENSALVILSNRLDNGFDTRTVQTSFAPGTPLIELTGNAADATIDPNGDLSEVLIVKSDGTVDIRAPRNKNVNGVEHGSGYLVYGVAGPQGQIRITDTAGSDITQVIAGSTPTVGQGGANGPSDNTLNGTTRLSDITVVNDATFKLRLETDAMTLPGGIRDQHADGDLAAFRIDGGIDANGNGVVDNVTPDDVLYGFEGFNDVNQPGYFEASGDGLYEQTIDVTSLSEGRHYLTGRVFRHRDPSTGGDGGPAVFTDFRKVIYVDRFDPESELVSFDPFASDPNNPNNRDAIVQSLDLTADSVHVFLDLAASLTEAEVLQMAQNGQGQAGKFDRDLFKAGFTNLRSGNHVLTVVTFEESGRSTVDRIVGQFAQTNIGLGLGDVTANGSFDTSDVIRFEQVLNRENAQFNAASDINADGLVDTRDLLLLGDVYTSAASQVVVDEYSAVLERRADLDESGTANTDDLVSLYENVGAGTWTYDLNVDGLTNAADAELLISELLRTVAGDYNLDGAVDAADYTLWRSLEGGSDAASLIADGDFDGDVDDDDFLVWRAAYGFSRQDLLASPSALAAASAIPEPTSGLLVLVGLMLLSICPRPKRPMFRQLDFS